MHVGHFATGLIGKRIDPKLSLGTMILAAMLGDILWCVFMLAGVEQIRITAGRGAANYFQPINIAYSHSLAMLLVWAAVFAGVHFLWRRSRRSALLLFSLVLSHWPLDVIAHKSDMPLAPGVPQQFGIGLWSNIIATIIVEGGLWLLSLVIYLRVTRSGSKLALFIFWLGVLLVTLSWLNNIAGPPPPDVRIAALASLIYFLLVVAWGYWLNRLRPAR